MDFKSYFSIPNDLLYFNTPGNGLMPNSHHHWRNKREKLFFEPAGHLRDQQNILIRELREGIANLFYSRPDHVFCVPNLSFGLNTLLAGLPKKTPVVLLEDEYPSVNYPIDYQGFDYQKIGLDEQLEQNIKKAITPNSEQILILSIVQYISGIKIDLEFIKELKQAHPKLYIIGDATQFFGTEEFNFEQSGFDAIGASGYKWMMAGYGNGFMLINERLQSILYKEAQRKPLPTEAMWAEKTVLATFFEPGHIDTLSHGTLLQSILFLKKANLETIRQHIHNLTNIAYEEFAQRQLLLPIANRKIKSPLINIQINPNDYTKLVAAGVRCFTRGTGIRIGLHLYNSEEDLKELLKIIDTI